MNRIIHVAASLVAAGSIASVCALTACSSAPSDATSETHEAFTYFKDVSIGPIVFDYLVRHDVDPDNCAFAVTNNRGTFTASPALRDSLHVDATIAEDIPPQSESAGICGTATITIPNLALDPGSLKLTLGASTIDVDATVSGAANAHTSGALCPNPTFNFHHVPVHASLAISNDSLVASDATVTLVGHTDPDCGAFGWCDGLASGYIGHAQTVIQNKLKAMVATQLAKPALQTSFRNIVVGVEQIPFGVSTATLVPGTLAIANHSITNQINFDAAPPGPVCTGTWECGYGADGRSVITCSSIWQGESLALQRLSGTQYETVQALVYAGNNYVAPTFYDSYTPAPNETVVTYRVCGADGSGDACGQPFNVANVRSCACTPDVACPSDFQCGAYTDGCSATHACGTCGEGNTCSSNHCCPTGTRWDMNSNACSTKGTVTCHAPMADCGGYCCRCSAKNPC